MEDLELRRLWHHARGAVSFLDALSRAERPGEGGLSKARSHEHLPSDRRDLYAICLEPASGPGGLCPALCRLGACGHRNPPGVSLAPPPSRAFRLSLSPHGLAR